MKILLLPGSKRVDSINFRLLQIVAEKLNGHESVVWDLVGSEDLDAPLYDGDCEIKDGVPDSIKALNRRMHDADALIVSSPEYNGFFSPLLKNTLDWMSRAQDGQPGTAVFRDKPALVLAASPGPMAGARALPHIRTQLSNLGLNVYRAQLGIGQAVPKLGKTGPVPDEKTEDQITEILDGFLNYAARLTD